ncbi:MAG: hypothetical protein ACE5I9_03025 [Candidatus Methylomirabilales bacterium]
MSQGRSSSRPTFKGAPPPTPSPFDELVLEVLQLRDRRVGRGDILGTDLIKAAMEKLQENDRKYPVERARGSARKYRKL